MLLGDDRARLQVVRPDTAHQRAGGDAVGAGHHLALDVAA